MVFKNTKGFKVWGNWAMLAPANHNMRFHSNSGYSDDFGTSSNAWDWATVNNAAYDYYNLCSQNGISAPPQNLSIWCYRNYDAGGMAWMIPRFEHLSLNINIYDLLQFHVGISLGILRNILPDIFIFPGNQKSPVSRLIHSRWRSRSRKREKVPADKYGFTFFWLPRESLGTLP